MSVYYDPKESPKERLLRGLIFIAIALLLALIMTLTGSDAKAQEKSSSIPKIQVGEKLPDGVWQQPLKMINDLKGREHLSLSEFKGKPIILDFWATWCGACITAMQKTDSLQAQFKGQFQVLSITTEKKQTVQTFLTRLSKQRNLTVRTIVEDATLTRLFTYYTLPHYIWIDSKGIIVRISGPEDLTALNISSFLKGSLTLVNNKQEERLPYDRVKPLFVAGNGGETPLLNYRSLLCSYTAGLPHQSSVLTDSLGRKISALNQPLFNLYKWAFRDHGHITTSRVKLEVADPGKLTSNLTGTAYVDWQKHGNGYCYELIVPTHLISRSYEIMQQDLDRFFPQYYARMEKQPAMCLVLQRTGKKDELKSKGGTPEITLDLMGGHMTNTPLSALMLRLSALYLQNEPYPLVDETGYQDPVDLSINANMTSPEALNNALGPYGLQLVKAERQVEMLVISDREPKQ